MVDEKSKQPDKNSRFRFAVKFRIWHLLVLAAIVAVVFPRITVCGNSPATLVVEDLQVNEDVQWGKHWATFDCRFEAPAHKAGEPVHCFIEVDKNFSFGEYEPGDRLHFRYQERQFLFLEQQDPRRIVFRKFFNLNIVPSKFSDGLYIRIGLDETDEESEDASGK